MSKLVEKTIPLAALSRRQQRLVERHLPLVYLTLQRSAIPRSRQRSGRERLDLVQEGCVALAEAIRRHDPARHGEFAPYAMARMHYAMSLFSHERSGLIRVPFRTQRSHAKRRTTSEKERHRPFPRVVTFGDLSASQTRRNRSYADQLLDAGERLTIGDLMRERIEEAMARAAEGMKHALTADGTLRKLVERCHEERWKIPAPEMKLSMGRVAAEVGTSKQHVANVELRARQRMMALLKADPVACELLNLAREAEEGFRRPATDDGRAGVERFDSARGDRPSLDSD